MLAKLRKFIASTYKRAFDVNHNNIGWIRVQRGEFFEKAKRLSDFVQIILSLSVCVVVIIKFSSYESESNDIISIVLFHLAKLFSLIFMANFAFYASCSIYYYVLSEVVIFKNSFIRFLYIAVCMLGYFGTVYGLVRLIEELSQAYLK